MLEIDGSQGEGGGQILRTALSLSCVSGMPVRVTNIRANRPNAGLARQHVAVCAALAKISGAKASRMEVGSTQFEFIPGKIAGGNYEFDIGSAGSTVLLAQALLPALFFADAPSRLVLHGGTHVMASPTFEYFKHVFLPAIARFGAHASAKLASPGFYPKGGGRIEIEAAPAKLHPAAFEPSGAQKIHAHIISCGLPPDVASRACSALLQKFPDAQIGPTAASGHSPGFAATLHSGFIGACALGRRGVRSEQVIEDAAAEFAQQLSFGAAADVHLADQLLPYMALSGSRSSLITSELSSHSSTNIAIIERFLPVKFSAAKEGACMRIST